MKSIVSRAPAVAVLLAGSAVIATACGGSQKELTAPQQAAAQAEDQAQKAQEQAQKAREEANKSQKELAEAQQSHDQARQAELAANQQAQAATRQAQIAEQQATMASMPPQPKPAAPPPQAAPPAEQKGAAEAQGQHAEHDSTGKLVIITTSLLFKSNSAELLDSSKPNLDEVADALNAQPKANTVKVQGYTDSTGSVDVNEALSQKRAESVADYLQSKGVAPDRISARGFGDQDPVSTEKTAEGRALNRRVDLIVEPAEGRANTQAPDKQQQQKAEEDQQKQDQQKQDQQKQP